MRIKAASLSFEPQPLVCESHVLFTVEVTELRPAPCSLCPLSLPYAVAAVAAVAVSALHCFGLLWGMRGFPCNDRPGFHWPRWHCTHVEHHAGAIKAGNVPVPALHALGSVPHLLYDIGGAWTGGHQ